MGFKLAPGDKPLNGYTIRRGLGLGGFGEVYFAVSDSGKEVALKRIHRNLDIEFRGAQQCLNLRHPNLVGLFDIRPEDDEQGWIVMEYIAGESLKELLDRSPSGLPEEDVLQLFGQIGAAVSYLHSQGIVHRDLKPANVFLEHGLVKIGDYGLSKFISASRRAGQTESVGTFHYMAPEIGKGEYGKEVDIYALGIILYEMLTGKVPFDGESSQEIIMKHLTSDPDLSLLKQPYCEIVGQALAKDPTQRFRTVSQMLEPLGIAIGPSGMAAQLSPVAKQVTSNETKPLSPISTKAHPKRYYREPIANAIARSVASLQRTIERVPYGSPSFVLMTCLLAFGFTVFGIIILPHLIFLGMVYIVYYFFWYFLYGYHLAREPVANIPNSISVGARSVTEVGPYGVPKMVHAKARPGHSIEPQKHARPLSFQDWQDEQRQHLSNRPWAVRWLEWTRSVLRSAVSAVIILVVAIVATAAINPTFQNTEEWIGAVTWTVAMTLLSSWMILFLAKLWERQPEDTLMYRFVLFASGLALGGVGYLLSEYLLVPWESVMYGRRTPIERYWDGFYIERSPAWPAFVFYFALLLGAIRWWRQADIVRRTRFSFFALAWSVLVAGILCIVVFFPTPWCLIVAGSTSLLVQLSTQTVNSRRRHRMVLQS
jgi:eukaryotic-like serine/threonine-protein kinase